MTTINRGVPTTLTVEWRQYAGGPLATVVGVDITITALDSTVVLATTTAGVATPTAGINAYTWTPDSDLAIGQYLVSWSGLDEDTDEVVATELVTVVAGGALGGPYADRATLKRRMGIPDATTSKDTDIDRALSSASAAINHFTGRQFGRAEVASERVFVAGRSGVDIDDVYDLTGLTVDGAAYATTGYVPEPLNGMRNGVPGWPYERLASPYGAHPIYLARLGWPGTTVTVSALWGWAQVPEDIRSACLMLASDQLKSADAPFGVAGLGDYVIRVRANPKVQELLNPYVKDIVKAAT